MKRETMKRRILRVIAIIVILTIILSTVTFAAMEASDYFVVTNAWISHNGNTVNVNFYALGTKMMDSIGLKHIYLYERNGNTWSLVQTYDYSDPLYATTLMATNSNMQSGYVSYSGSADKQYYASCWFYAEKNGGSDTITQNAY